MNYCAFIVDMDHGYEDQGPHFPQNLRHNHLLHLRHRLNYKQKAEAK
jgi:hypothetical protein